MNASAWRGRTTRKCLTSKVATLADFDPLGQGDHAGVGAAKWQVLVLLDQPSCSEQVLGIKVDRSEEPGTKRAEEGALSGRVGLPGRQIAQPGPRQELARTGHGHGRRDQQQLPTGRCRQGSLAEGELGPKDLA